MPPIPLARPYEAWTQILKAIVWQRPNGALAGYQSWSRAEKRELEQAVERVLAGETLGLPVAPVPATYYGPAAMPWTELSPDDAWRSYIGHVAQSLALEIQHRAGDWPWSITNDPPLVWRVLFDSRETFVVWPNAYGVGWATPGDPVRTFRFLASSGLLAPTRRRTIERLLAWCRRSLLHYVGGFTAASAQAHWQYDGSPPVERIIRGTVSSAAPQFCVRHWTLGPTIEPRRAFAAPFRQRERVSRARRRSLRQAHRGDPTDPHRRDPDWAGEVHRLVRSRCAVAASTPQHRPAHARARDRVPSHELLHHHCADLAAGLGHAASSVYALFQNHYTLAELEAGALWQRMDEKLVELGGCGSVPAVRYGT
jgi:hypothetical protein